jgi:hypothetical protein
MADAFAVTYGVEILFDARPILPKSALLRNLRRWCPHVVPIDGDAQGGSLHFVHPDQPLQLADARVQAQTVVVAATRRPDPAKYEHAIRQTWEFGGARSAVGAATASVLVTDLMTSPLEYHRRLDLFHRGLRGVLETAPGLAIHWQHSGRIVDARDWARQFDAGDPAQLFFAGAVNVRMFKVQEGATGVRELVMDTLGLAALGLPDLQCHFRDLDPGAVARVLYNSAWYVYSSGDIITDGHTIEGIDAGSRWRCQHQAALVAPERVVLNLDPGPG